LPKQPGLFSNDDQQQVEEDYETKVAQDLENASFNEMYEDSELNFDGSVSLLI